jgi:uncharacterized Zn-finger protein
MDAPNKSPAEIIHAKSRAVSCDGGEGVYGHPKVYLRIADKQIICPYCSRVFILQPGATDSAH